MDETRTPSLIMDYRQAIDIAIMPLSIPSTPIVPDFHIPHRKPPATHLHPNLPPPPTRLPPLPPKQPPAPTPPRLRVLPPMPPPPSHALSKNARHPIAEIMRVPRYQIGRDPSNASTPAESSSLSTMSNLLVILMKTALGHSGQGQADILMTESSPRSKLKQDIMDPNSVSLPPPQLGLCQYVEVMSSRSVP